MTASTRHLAINLAFLGILLAPPVAAVLSPQFPQFVKNVVANRASMATEVEKLRRSTPLWSDSIDVFNTALYRLGHSANSNIGVIGKDGWMFLGNDNQHSFDESYGRYMPSDQALQDWITVMRAEVGYARRRGIPILYVAAPSTGTIYPDKLPAHAPGFDKTPTALDRLTAMAQAEGLPMLDVRPALVEARRTADTYSPFNSHWTNYGGWVAWRAIAARISADLGGAHMAKADAEPKIATSASVSVNEFAGMLGIQVDNPWTNPVFSEPLPSYQAHLASGAVETLPGDTPTDLLDLPRTTTNASATTPYSVLFYRDSQGDSLSPFIQASFSTSYQMEHNVRNGMTPFNFIGPIEQYKPNYILYVFTERYLTYPLGDVNYWKRATYFDAAPVVAGTWPSRPDFAPIGFSGEAALDTAQSLKLPAATGGTGRILQLQLGSQGIGQVYVGYQVDGKTHEGWHPLMAGNNVIFIDLPDRIDGDNVWMIRDVNQSRLTLVSATLKQS